MKEPNQDPTSIEGEEQLPTPEPPKGAAVEPEKGAEEEKVEKPPIPPAERTYSTAEWNKRQSALDKQIEEVRKEHKEAIKQLQVQLNQKLRQDFISQAEARGESGEQAGTLFDLQARLQDREAELVEVAKVLDVAQKARTANELAEKYGLSSDAKDSLLKAETPADMKVMALEMSLETTKAKATPPTKTPSGVGTGKGIDTSKATPRERAEEYFRELYGEK